MGPDKPLPYHDSFKDAESYVESLLEFITTSTIFQTVCGGVHVLDIFTRTPDLYTAALPSEWRVWFATFSIEDILDLLLREDLSLLLDGDGSIDTTQWRNGAVPPKSLIDYIYSIRRHRLDRDFKPTETDTGSVRIPQHLTVGMKEKKKHEVSHFAGYVSRLSDRASAIHGREVSHIVDFGSGQNYLGRTLASEPYGKSIIAVESEAHNVSGAKAMDVYAKLARKGNNMRNKKAYRGEENDDNSEESGKDRKSQPLLELNGASSIAEAETEGQKICYIPHKINSGDLSSVFTKLPSASENSNNTKNIEPCYMVISLHSCGNLLHHGLRTIELNPSVSAVALVGCCYNLMTERLSSDPSATANSTNSTTSLRYKHPRLGREGSACDANGFPMSKRLEQYQPPTTDTKSNTSGTTGIRLNLTARMLAVQAPANWTSEESAAFFKRHFYRALLQRFFLDCGVVGHVRSGGDDCDGAEGRHDKNSISAEIDGTAWTEPLTIGKLSKKSYQSFPQYATDAIAKSIRIACGLSGLSSGQDSLPLSTKKTTKTSSSSAAVSTLLTRLETVAAQVPQERFERYAEEYGPRRHEVEVLWSLMAFSAEVVEAVIVLDRWLYLCELEKVGPGRAWVEAGWEYGASPRNLVVVGVKKKGCDEIS